MSIQATLSSHRDAIMERWRNMVRGSLAPEAIGTAELTNHIPIFLDEILSALRGDAGLSTKGPAPDESSTAAVHGRQRLRLGFSLDSVVREYGALRDAIIHTVSEAGAEMTLRELQVLFNCIIGGIADAVSEYARQRDAELQRQGNEHFAFIAHELRNPLSSATMALDLLKASGKLPADGRLVDVIERNLLRTNELVNQTLEHARVASGIALRRQLTTLSALFEDVQFAVASEAEFKGVGLALAIAQDAPVNLDLRLVQSAIGNLLRNAVKYTAAHSNVVLRGTVADGLATIEVEDCCGGLPPGKVEAAFAPFVQLANQRSGFGLGLAIAKQAAEAHGGSIRVQNLPGKGCIFVLELPAGQ